MSDNFVREEVEDAVELGIEYLNFTYGGVTGLDWLSKVDRHELDMSSNYSCVLGLVSGNFATHLLVTQSGFDKASELGFYLTADDMNHGLTYDDLTTEWKRRIQELKKRRADALLRLEHSGISDSWLEG